MGVGIPLGYTPARIQHDQPSANDEKTKYQEAVEKQKTNKPEPAVSKKPTLTIV
jgi:hypothetical protein